MFFLSPGSWHKSSEVCDIRQRTPKSAVPYDQLTLQQACSWLHKASQPLHCSLLPGGNLCLCFNCSKSQVFPPKACNVHASFKSGIHLGLGRGGWCCWAVLLLSQVQERHLGDAPFPRRWVWCKEHPSKGEMGFVESSEH